MIINMNDDEEYKRWRSNIERELQKPPLIIQWIMRASHGRITNERKAIVVVFIVLGIATLVTAGVVFSITREERAPHPDYYRRYLEQQRR
jgi:hypothetical protein